MKTVEEIEDEYKDFKLKSDFIKSTDDFKLFLLVGLEDTYVLEEDNNREIRINNRNKLDARIRGFLSFRDNADEVGFYDEDNNILEEINKLVESYRNMYFRMSEIVTDDNYRELTRLVDFSTEYYNYHIDFFESERDSLEMYMKGICMYNPKYSDNRDVVQEFMDKKMNELSSNKKLVKKV